MIRALVLLLALGSALVVVATHNRAGEIIVCKLNEDPQDLRYQVTIITHTKLSAPADRPELVLNWGDGQVDTVARTSIVDDPPRDLRRSEYVAVHQYAGPGEFILSFDDQNRNGGVLNVPNSIAQSFCVKTKLVISPVTGHNCSVRFLNAPIQNACINQPWIHNPAAFDVDGDSLSFEPAVCLGLYCEPIAGYTFPGPNYSINPTTGLIVWNAPSQVGEYNIAFLVREWRRDINNIWRNVGWVMRDMQITVVPCDNQPPVLVQRNDTCVVAGTTLTFPVQASDPNATQSVSLSAQGEPFQVPSPAVLNAPPASNPITGTFNWGVNCSHVRPQSYLVVFNAVDNGQPALQDFKTMSIRVIAPRPENPLALPVGNAIQLQWDASVCANANGYRIYRRSGPFGFVPGYCETDVPAYTGYQFIGSVQGQANTTFLDEGPLVFGNQYCYMVVATFANGARSIASAEVCAILDRQVPLITNVSVEVTDATAGIDTVRWTNAYDLDTLQRPGPYQFKLYRGTGFSTAGELVYTSTLHPFLAHPDTQFIDTGLNTRDQAHVYRVEFFGDGGDTFIGTSNTASSVFISAVPNDQQLTIQWALNVPWTNAVYEVFRFDDGDWALVGTSTTGSYTDTALVNGSEYCYRVVSIGAYSDPAVAAPLINYSQEVCGVPVDLTPPCVPELALDNDCELPLNTLTWTNPAVVCGDGDTWGYRVFFSDSIGAPFLLIAEIEGAANTLFTHTNGSSVAGCYTITAVDTLGNESAFSTTLCGDNCPEYVLPNVFTPNGDGRNDRFGPFPYRGVKAIDLQVFNRWGQVVHETTDPDIEWNGTHKDNGEPLSDGVYFYVCEVVYTRLAGDERIVLKGHVQLVGGGAPQRLN